MHLAPFCLLGVHIADGILSGPWLAGGFALAALLVLVGAWGIRDEEIAPVALLTAAFFVASLIHVRLPATSVHLLLNGLVGVVLGRRAALAIPVGLFLQAALIGHGGFTTLGINTCVMLLPALFAWQLFGLLQRLPWTQHRWFRAGLVIVIALVWTLSVVYIATLLAAEGEQFGLLTWLRGLAAGGITDPSPISSGASAWALRWTFHPATLAGALALSLLAAWGEDRLGNAPEFPIGLLVGAATVLLTACLNCLVLAWGGQEDWQVLAQLVFVAHLPIALIEGIVLGFSIGFLARVKPEMLRSQAAKEAECSADAVR